ncbi:MAG: efflux RND transporter permease subunit [Bryobacteraceae bacterium]
MINLLIRWSLANRFGVLAIALLLMVGGSIVASRMPVDVFPDLTAPTVTVIVEGHSMSPLEMETQVTFPIETAVNGAADATFLRNRLRDYVGQLGSYLRALYPDAVLEVLFPYDVNYPHPAGIHTLGGRLNHYVNFPMEWSHKSTAGFDRLKMEALDFGAWCRDLDLALTAPRFALDQDWTGADIRHLIPVFVAGYPWEKEVQRSLALGIAAVNLWAFDHICIFNLKPQPGRPLSTAQRVL